MRRNEQKANNKPAVTCCGQIVRNGRCQKCGSEYQLAVRRKDRTKNSQTIFILQSGVGLATLLMCLAAAATLWR